MEAKAEVMEMEDETAERRRQKGGGGSSGCARGDGGERCGGLGATATHRMR